MPETDPIYMRRALDLAARARGRTSPNPMVGAVLVKDDQVVGEGFHAYAGSDHAEVAGSLVALITPEAGQRQDPLEKFGVLLDNKFPKGIRHLALRLELPLLSFPIIQERFRLLTSPGVDTDQKEPDMQGFR